MDVWFHGYGCGKAPWGWKLNHFPYTNRLYFVRGGTARFLSENGDVPLRPGHLYLFPHRLPFDTRQDENDPLDHLYFDFVLTPPLTGDRLVSMPVEEGSLIGHTIAALMLAVRSFTMRTPADEALVRRYFLNLLQLVLDASESQAPADARLMPVLARMHEGFGEPLCDAELAALAHMEKNHFIRVFRRTMGMTPYQYLREFRLNRAVTLIAQGTTVSEAAALCGFESAASLSHAMRRSRGLSPKEAAGRIFRGQNDAD